MHAHEPHAAHLLFHSALDIRRRHALKATRDVDRLDRLVERPHHDTARRSETRKTCERHAPAAPVDLRPAQEGPTSLVALFAPIARLAQHARQPLTRAKLVSSTRHTS